MEHRKMRKLIKLINVSIILKLLFIIPFIMICKQRPDDLIFTAILYTSPFLLIGISIGIELETLISKDKSTKEIEINTMKKFSNLLKAISENASSDIEIAYITYKTYKIDEGTCGLDIIASGKKEHAMQIPVKKT